MINHSTWLLVSVLLLPLPGCGPPFASEQSAIQQVSNEEYANKRQLVEQLRLEGIQNQGVLDAGESAPSPVCTCFVPPSRLSESSLPIGGSNDLATFYSWLHD